jgi:succinyl-diaminopimelate desuccinylase
VSAIPQATAAIRGLDDLALDLSVDPVQLTARLVDVPSVSGSERPLADAVEAALRALPHLRVERDGDAVVAFTELGRDRRVVLAGHLDTVPIVDNVPSHREGQRMYGCGTSDMKSGVAVLLHLAATVPEPTSDVTYICYDNEEVEAARNGLLRLAATHRDWLAGDLAILLEPTDGVIEAGCQGTLRVEAVVPGRRAHSARSWLGDNAIHAAAPLLATLSAYEPRQVDIDGCGSREGLSAVKISGGVAGNVVPDLCTVTINFRFAPDRSEAQALDHVREVLQPYELALVDSAPGALPGLASPAAQAFVAAAQASGGAPRAKYGWTDVARFAALGIPALNYGPGDPNLAHTREESIDVARIGQVGEVLRNYLIS